MIHRDEYKNDEVSPIWCFCLNMNQFTIFIYSFEDIYEKNEVCEPWYGDHIHLDDMSSTRLISK